MIALQGAGFELGYARAWAERMAPTELLERAVAEADVQASGQGSESQIGGERVG